MLRSRIIGCGAYLPEKVLSNEDLATTIDTSNDWIVERTGITRRHIAAEGELTSDLAHTAAERAILAAGIDVSRSSIPSADGPTGPLGVGAGGAAGRNIDGNRRLTIFYRPATARARSV